MKSKIISMILALGSVATFGSTLNAQTFQLSGTIPFAFHVADRNYEPGKYTVSQNSTMVPSLTEAATHHSTFVPGALPSLTGDARAKLVFHCYNGTKCYLAEIWPGTGHGIRLSQSKGEKEIIREGRREMASILIDLHAAD